MTTITVFQCDPAGWFAGPTEAHESPLEPGVFHVPAGCVEDAPPEPGADTWPRYVAGAWVLQARPAAPPPDTDMTPAAKLAHFLASNPDVADLINRAQPPAA